MAAKKGLIASINEVRSLSSNQYQANVPEVTDGSGIEKLAIPL